MGPLILAHEGTFERFAGDGLMIFFNDPIKLENPTQNAVKMALAMQGNLAPLRAAWKKRGFELDLGIGIAQGDATLGAIGFEGPWDYACIGSVTNLAARLCSEAKGGQILTNQKTLSRIEDAVQAEPPGRYPGIAETSGFRSSGSFAEPFKGEAAEALEIAVERSQCGPVFNGECSEMCIRGQIAARSRSDQQPCEDRGMSFRRMQYCRARVGQPSVHDGKRILHGERL